MSLTERIRVALLARPPRVFGTLEMPARDTRTDRAAAERCYGEPGTEDALAPPLKLCKRCLVELTQRRLCEACTINQHYDSPAERRRYR